MMWDGIHLEDILASVTEDQSGWTCDPCEVPQNDRPPSTHPTHLADLISLFNQGCGFPDADDFEEPHWEEDGAAGSLDVLLALKPFGIRTRNLSGTGHIRLW